MTIYSVPAVRPYQRPFRVLSWAAIVVLLGIWAFSAFEPADLSQSVNVSLALTMGAIALSVLVVGVTLAQKEGMWKVKHAYQWELTDEKLIQRHDDGNSAEIPLAQIQSLQEVRGWLQVRSPEPARGIAIPSDIDGFEEVRRVLAARCSTLPVRVRVPLLSYLPHLVGWLAILLLFISQVRNVVVLCAVIILLWQGWAIYSLNKFWQRRGKKIPAVFWLSWVFSLIAIAWIFFRRMRTLG